MSALHLPTPQAAAAYLAGLPLADPVATLERLLPYVATLAAQPLAGLDQLAPLQDLDEPLALVIEEVEKRLRGRPLPYGDAEAALLGQTLRLLGDCADAWHRLGEIKLPAQTAAPTKEVFEPAQAYERALFYRSQALQLALLSRSEPPPGLWRRLHGDFAAAEAAGVAARAWPDRKGRSVGPQRHYVGALLIDMAKPASLSFRAQRLTQRWARRLGKLALVAQLPGGDLPPFVIDLKADRGLRKLSTGDVADTSALRALDSSALADHLQRLKGRLKEGRSPAELGLGEGLTTDECSRLIDHLRPPWSQRGLARAYAPEAMIGQARLITSFAALAWHLGQLTPQEGPLARTRNDFDRLVVFGSATPREAAKIPEATEWGVIERGTEAWRLFHPRPPERLFHDQLVALADETGDFVLGRVSSLLLPTEGGLAIKVRRLDGAVAGVQARFTDAGETNPALWLEHHHAPALLLPRGTYRRGRIAEVQRPGAPGSERHQWRLDSILAAGQDCELCAVSGASVGNRGSLPSH